MLGHLLTSLIAFFAGFHEELGFWTESRALDFLLRSALFATFVSGIVMPIALAVLARRGRTSLADSLFYIVAALVISLIVLRCVVNPVL